MEPAPIDRSVGSAPDCLLAVRAAEAGRALRLARAGCTYRDSGVRLGLSTASAWRRHRWAVAVLSSSEDVALPSTRGVCPPALRPVYLDGPDRELMRLRPRPARRCAARRKRGGPCGAWAIHGGVVCRMHGGAAPQVRSAARVRHSWVKAGALLAAMDVDDGAGGWGA